MVTRHILLGLGRLESLQFSNGQEELFILRICLGYSWLKNLKEEEENEEEKEDVFKRNS